MNKRTIALLAVLFIALLVFFGTAFAEESADNRQATFVLPAALIEIEDEAFSGTAVETVIFPQGFQRIGDGAFKGARRLKGVYIPDTTEYIADSAFSRARGVMIHGIDDSYAKKWAKRHRIPFVVDDIWTKVVLSGWSPTIRIVPVDLYIATIVLIVLFEIFKLGYYEVRSRRPQDRPDLYPIEYRFP